MLDKLAKIQWQWAAIVAFIVGIPSLVFFIMGFTPRVTVKNDLAVPVRIYANQKYLGQIGGSGKRTFRFTSKIIFPVRVTWRSVQFKAQNGSPLGDMVQGDELVDNYRTLEITHTSGDNFYFMPVITNNTDMTCKIYVNDGLKNELYGGLLLPRKENVNAGYYKWVGNSNVTLYCDDSRPRWWGERNGQKQLASELVIKAPNGLTELTLNP